MPGVHKSKNFLGPLLVVLFFLIGFSGFLADRWFFKASEKSIKINNVKLIVEIADTPGKRSRGLSGHKNMSENRGMLFLFPETGYHNFWMKEMNFPLDFIWINGDRIVDITENVKPEDYQPPNYFTSEYPTSAVLEINAGLVDKFNIREGDKVEF